MIRFSVQLEFLGYDKDDHRWLHYGHTKTPEDARDKACKDAADNGEWGPFRVRVYEGDSPCGYPFSDPVLETWAATVLAGTKIERVYAASEWDVGEAIDRTRARARA